MYFLVKILVAFVFEMNNKQVNHCFFIMWFTSVMFMILICHRLGYKTLITAVFIQKL